MVVEYAEGHVEAALRALLREARGDRLGGAEVGAEQHRQRGAVPGDQRGGCGRWKGGRVLRLGGPGCAVEADAGPGSDLDVELVGLDRQC
jgi:hypothetical protein